MIIRDTIEINVIFSFSAVPAASAAHITLGVAIANAINVKYLYEFERMINEFFEMNYSFSGNGMCLSALIYFLSAFKAHQAIRPKNKKNNINETIG